MKLRGGVAELLRAQPGLSRDTSLRQQWIEMHCGRLNEPFNPAAVNLNGIPARREPAGQVVCRVAGQSSRRADSPPSLPEAFICREGTPDRKPRQPRQVSPQEEEIVLAFLRRDKNDARVAVWKIRRIRRAGRDSEDRDT